MPFIAAFNFVVDVVKGIIAWLGDAVAWIWDKVGSIPVVGKVAQAAEKVAGFFGLGGGGGPSAQDLVSSAPNVFRDPSTPPTGSVSVAGSGPASGQTNIGSNNTATTVNVDKIEISAPGADSREISQNVREYLGEELRALAFGSATGVQ